MRTSHLSTVAATLIVFLDTYKASKKMTRKKNIVNYQKMLKLSILDQCLDLAIPW